MRIHRREIVVRDARNKLELTLMDVIKEFDLTTGEQLRVVTDVFANYVGTIAKYAIRAERHPEDPDKPGGQA